MRPITLAVMSDLHGNLEATEAVLEDIRKRGAVGACCLRAVSYRVNREASCGTSPTWRGRRLEARHYPLCTQLQRP